MVPPLASGMTTGQEMGLEKLDTWPTQQGWQQLKGERSMGPPRTMVTPHSSFHPTSPRR